MSKFKVEYFMTRGVDNIFLYNLYKKGFFYNKQLVFCEPIEVIAKKLDEYKWQERVIIDLEKE